MAGVVLAALVLIVLAGGAFTTTSRVEVGAGPATPFATPPADGSYAVVVGSHQTTSPYVDLFGLKIGPARYAAHVMFVAPEGCGAAGSSRIEATGPCTGIPVAGEVTGGGTNEEGRELIIVSVKISEACHEILVTGDRWPHSDPACPAP